MPEDISNTAPEQLTDERIDELADGTDKATNRERPMKEEPEKPAAQTKAEEQYEFEHGGKKVKATRDQLIRWAQMGYDRPQAMQKFNQEKARLEQERTQIQDQLKKWDVYRQIDEYASKNPDWWNHYNNAWQQRTGIIPQAAGTPQAVQTGTAQPDPRYNALEQKLTQFEQFFQTLQADKQAEAEKAEDQKLETEIKSIRDANPDFDWATVDGDGKSLELRVLEYAQANSIPTFKAAFRDLLHDELVDRAAAKSKIDLAKGIQTKSKLGVLGVSPTPQKWNPSKPVKDIRNTSYEELEQEIREEIRSGRVGK